MKTLYVAQDPSQVIAFLQEEVGIQIVPPVFEVQKVRRFHDDVWEDVNARSDLGEIWTEYAVELPDDCQNHIKDFSEITRLQENVLYILSRSFCTICNKIFDNASYVLA